MRSSIAPDAALRSGGDNRPAAFRRKSGVIAYPTAFGAAKT
jgi:hypothetical protein